MRLVEQELLTLPEQLISPPIFNGVRVTRSLGLCICFVDRCLSFCTFSFGHFVLLRYTDSDYPFGIFKLFIKLIVVLFSAKEVQTIILTLFIELFDTKDKWILLFYETYYG